MDNVREPDDFSIATPVSLVEEQFLTLKHGDMFAVFDARGDIRAVHGGTQGIFANDTRMLSEYELLLGGHAPMLLSATLRDDNATLTCDLTNPELPESEIEGNLIHARRSRFLWKATCHERISIRNFDLEARQLRVEIRFGADFADLFEVRGMSRARHGQHEPATAAGDTVLLSYTGLDKRVRQTRLRFSPQPARLTEGSAVFEIELPPHGRSLIFVEIACDAAVPGKPQEENFLACMREQRRWVQASSARAAAIDSSNEIFNEAMRRAISDLTMLTTDEAEGPYPYAGIPWFSTNFGRDALITALNVLWMDPEIARGVLLYLAANQATTMDAASDAEPGKILHEVRHGEMAELREVPFRRYYGSVDATPLFVLLAGAYWERTGDLATVRRLWPNVQAAIKWVDSYASRNPQGFLSYFRQTEEGLANQGWKDSFDSISHADGRLAEGPITLCEVQAYAFGARQAAAAMARALDLPGEAVTQESKAEALRAHFEEAFWDEALGTYVLALDGKGEACRVRASNAGHVLLTGIAAPDRAARLATGLMDVRGFNGWGVRTLASVERRYNPMSYHNGSVWPHDNALIAMGLSRYGLKAPVERIFTGLFEASLYMNLRRLPELFCGFARRRGQGPTNYPVACSPQAWAATALHASLGASLGLSFTPSEKCVVFDRPCLPPFLQEVRLHHLRLGDAQISVVLRRMGSEVAMNVFARTGEIRAVLVS